MAALGLGQLLSSKLKAGGDSGAAGGGGLLQGFQMGPAGAEFMMHPGKTQSGLGRKGWP